MKWQWGPWRFERGRMALVLRWPVGNAREHYVIHLSRCHNSAGLLDWLAQVRGLVPAEHEAMMVGSLLQAFDDLFDLQRNVCGSEIDHEFSAFHLIKARRDKESELLLRQRS
jgi:hypothetical protein